MTRGGFSLLDKGREEAQLRATETPSLIRVNGTILFLLSQFLLRLSDAGFLFTVMINDFLFNRFKMLRTGRFERNIQDVIGGVAGRWNRDRWQSQAQAAAQPLCDPGQVASPL